MNEPISNNLPPDVSVLIVNFNGLRFLESCLDSLKAAFKRYTFETVIIDNASSDGSQAFLRERKDIRYIESPENLGFTGGNNRAAAQARGKVLLLLNNDTCVPSSLDPMIDVALQEDVGAAGCRLVYGDGRLQFSAGLEHSPLRLVLSWMGLEKRYKFPSVFRRVETNPAFYETSRSKVDWVSGACLATQRNIWEKLKGLDESFFMYCEDVDYCLRVRLMGKRVAYVHDVNVVHYEGAGKAWVGRMALLRSVTSYKTYLSKYYSKVVVRTTLFMLSQVFIGRAVAFLIKSLIVKGVGRDIAKDKSLAYKEASVGLLKNAVQ